MALDIKSSHQCEMQCSPVLEILDDILVNSTTAPIPALIEGLLDAATGSAPRSVIPLTPGPKATSTLSSSSEASADSDSGSESVASSVSSSSDSSSSSSTSSSKRENDLQTRKDELARTVQEPRAEEDAKHLRSKNEIDPDKISVATPRIVISPQDEITPVGKIVSAVDSVVVISTTDWRLNDGAERQTQSKPSPLGTNLNSVSALDHGSVLCFEDRKLLGLVDETFGPVECPFYVVRFNTVEERDATGATQGRMVYLVKQKSTWVRGSDVISKGYDTSNWDDEECNIPDEYSDDEEERAARKAQRRARGQKRENGMEDPNEQKRRRLSASHPKRERGRTPEAHINTVRRGSQRGRLRPKHGVNPNMQQRSDSVDARRWNIDHTSVPIDNTTQFGDPLRGESTTAPDMYRTDTVVSPEFYAQARYTFPHNVPERGYTGGPPVGSASLAPIGQQQQFHHHQRFSEIAPPVRNPYSLMGSALPGANVGAPHQNEAHGHYVTHGMSAFQQPFNRVPTPYWHGGLPHQMYPQRNSAEVSQRDSFYTGPVDNQSILFNGGSMSQRHMYEGTNYQMGLSGVNLYPPVGSASYTPRTGRPTHVDQEAELEQPQQQIYRPRPPRGG